jgi:hypothetical protein
MRRTRGEIIGMRDKEVIEHRGGGEESAEDKHEAVLPESPKELLVAEHEDREEDDEDEGGDPESDVGVESCPKDEARDEKISETMGAEASEEEVKGKSEEKRRHDGPKADPGEVDRPVRGSEHKSGNDAGTTSMVELTSEEVEAEDGEGAKENRGELESSDGIAQYRDEKGLDVDKETLPTIVGRVKELVGAGFNSMDSIDAIGCFVGIESDRNLLYLIEANDEREEEDSDECAADEPREVLLCDHSVLTVTLDESLRFYIFVSMVEL